jgi:hypothetical protein
MQIGQTVYLRPTGNTLRSRGSEIEEQIIKTVGRKYITTWDGYNEYTERQFHIDTLREKTEYCVNWVLFFSKQDILDEDETNALHGEIRQAFNGYGKSIFSLDQLRRIAEIIREDSK